MRVVLCDLDDTLFDHHRATREALSGLQADGIAFQDCPLDELDRCHRELLEAMHPSVLAGAISPDDARVERFRRLRELLRAQSRSVSRPAAEIARHYRALYDRSWHAVPGARELLAAIKTSGLLVVVVTNNHRAEQDEKLRRVDLAEYVDALITSEEAGCCKPEPDIFHQALARSAASAGEAVMLGDAWDADIEGARRVGVRAVWLNRFNRASPDPAVAELRSLEPTSTAVAVLSGPAEAGRHD